MTRPDPPARIRAGFTLLELMLVVVISLLAAAIAVPSFVRSFRGAKLRTSCRAVVMAHRYARSVAVLQQTHVSVLYGLGGRSIEVVAAAPGTRTAEHERFLALRGAPGAFRPIEDLGEQEAGPAAGGGEVRLRKTLPEGVLLTELQRGDDIRAFDGAAWVNYYPNGMCDAHALTLVDEQDRRARVEVEDITGDARVEYLPL